MNSRQLQYAILLSQKRNFSHVAKELNITQPALSKQILSLETELGIKLFERNSNPIKLTSAGEFFVREAKELLYKEEQLLHSIEQFKSGDKGQLVIGITPFRSAYLISGIIKKIREKFPDVHIKLVEEGSEDLRNDVVDGKFDFAIVNLPVDESLLEIKPIESDKLALVISNELVEKHPFLKNKTNINFKDCGDIPFVVASAGQDMRMLFDKLCSLSKINPNIVTEVVNLTTSWEISCSGIAAALLPLQFIDSTHARNNLTILNLNDDIHLRQPVIVRRQGQFLSKFAEYAIDLLLSKE